MGFVGVSWLSKDLIEEKCPTHLRLDHREAATGGGVARPQGRPGVSRGCPGGFKAAEPPVAGPHSYNINFWVKYRPKDA